MRPVLWGEPGGHGSPSEGLNGALGSQKQLLPAGGALWPTRLLSHRGTCEATFWVFLHIFNLSQDTKFPSKLKFPSEGCMETAVLQFVHGVQGIT
jgi:hypothetical protein